MVEHLVPVPAADYSSPAATNHIPRAVVDVGPGAAFAYDELIRGALRNPHTRAAYGRAIRSFLDWLEPSGVTLTQVTPGMVGAYLDQLALAPPSKKLALAALRRFFDALVLRHVLILNPAASVRGERYEVVEGKTPEATPDQARALLASIDTSTPVGLRDRAVIATLIYTAARAGAVARLWQNDFRPDGTQYVLRFVEKGGKQREIPVSPRPRNVSPRLPDRARRCRALAAAVPLDRSQNRTVYREADDRHRHLAHGEAPAGRRRITRTPVTPFVPRRNRH